jgi:hypothetical protein
MGQEQFYSAFSAAKRNIGNFRILANNAKKSPCHGAKSVLHDEIVTMIDALKTSLPFFRSIGMACETEVMITLYSTFLCQVDSS